MSPTITFHGAAGGVTGACFLVRHAQGAVLVDCGMFQGPKTVRELNWRPFPFDPREIDAVLLTHAHIDHSGLIPKLRKHGFRGRVTCTRATADLLEFMLPDSGFIQESEVERLNARNRQRGREAVEPIYTKADAEAALDHLSPVDLDCWVDVQPGVRARFWEAGHILGSASIELAVADGEGTVTLLFSGDLGPGDKAFHGDPSGPTGMDWIVTEATYGGRIRTVLNERQRQAALADEVRAALARGGNIIIPSFAVERTQELLYDLDVLFDSGALPVTDVFLDSPLAVRITGVFERHLPSVNIPGTQPPFRRGNLRLVESAEHSKRLNRLTGGAIILAASGMCEAGRIRHHLKHNLWRRNATVLFVGYQAPGTLGRILQQGVGFVRIHGEEIEVKATVRTLDTYSGHADQAGLLSWIKARGPIRRGLFIAHGEDAERAALRDRLRETGMDPDAILLPMLDEACALSDGKPVAAVAPKPPQQMPRLPKGHLPETDWHNTYAGTVLDLSERLRALPDDASRARVLARVREALAADPAAGEV